MKVKELLDVTSNLTMLRIVQGKKDLYIGYKGMIHYECKEAPEWMEETVKGFENVLEIRHKQYREKGLMKPLLPEALPQYSFSDLMMTLYFTITI